MDRETDSSTVSQIKADEKKIDLINKAARMGINKYQFIPLTFMIVIGFAIMLVASSYVGQDSKLVKEYSLLSVPAGAASPVASEEQNYVLLDDSKEITLLRDITISLSNLNDTLVRSSKLKDDKTEQKTDATDVAYVPPALLNPVSLSADKLIEREAQIRANEKAAQERTAAVWNERVASNNRKLYLPQYYYGAPAMAKNSYGSYPINTKGIPMSDIKMPDSLTFDENGVPTNYLYCIQGKSTAYYGGIGTATGQRVHQGCVAVDPRIIPYGTEMWIVSSDGKYIYGYARAEDTGGFIYYKNGALVDLYMDTYSYCCTWGARNVTIYILPSTY